MQNLPRVRFLTKILADTSKAAALLLVTTAALAAPQDLDPVERKSAKLTQAEMIRAWDNFEAAHQAVLYGDLQPAYGLLRAGLMIHPAERDFAALAAVVAEAQGRYGDALTFFQLSSRGLKLTDPHFQRADRGISRVFDKLVRDTSLVTCVVLGMKRESVFRQQCDSEN